MKNINIKSLFVLAVVVMVSSYSYSQKELTLEDAVMQQYRSFYPKSTFGVNWIPNTDSYSFLDAYVNLKKSTAKSNSSKTIATIQEVNTATGANLQWFSGFEWVNQNEFIVSDGVAFYSYNVKTKEGKTILKAQDNASNGLFNSVSNNLAYTVGNNLNVTSGHGVTTEITKNTDENIVSGQAIARSEFGITGGLFWSKDGKQLAFYQKDESKVADYPLLDNSVTPGKLMSIKYPMAGQGTEKARVGIYSIEKNKTVFIETQYGEENYLTNLSWSLDGSFVLIAEVNRAQDHMWLCKYNSSTGELIKVLFEEQSDKWIEPEHPAYFVEGSQNSFIWISEKTGFNNLYHYSSEGELINQLTNHSFVVKNIAKVSSSKVYYNATGESPLETHLFSVDFKGNSRQITKQAGTHQTRVSSNGKYVFDNYSSHDTPSVDQVINSSGSVIKEVLRADNALANYKIGEATISSIQAKDGSKLYTRMIKPSSFDSTKTYPVLVYVYGGPHAQLITNSWLDGASLWMYWMAEQGYIVYTVDNRGSAERGFAFESQIHRQLGEVEMEDQLSGVDYLKSLSYIDGNRIAVHGWSFGGFMTTSLMLRNPGVYTTGVAGGPVIDWKYYEIMYGERYMDQPSENPEGYKNNALVNYADQLDGNLLLIHGTVDDVVVMQHSFALVQKCVELGVQMDFFPYPMHKHNVRGKDRVHLMSKVLNYILENNK